MVNPAATSNLLPRSTGDSRLDSEVRPGVPGSF